MCPSLPQRARRPAAATSECPINGNHDVLTQQDLPAKSVWLPVIPAPLRAAGLGNFSTCQASEYGFASRMTGIAGALIALPQTGAGALHLN